MASGRKLSVSTPFWWTVLSTKSLLGAECDKHNSAKCLILILQPKSFFSISLIHNVLSMKTAGGCPMMMPLNQWLFGSRVKTSKHLYLCTWEVLHLSEKELYTGVQYGVAEFSALVSKSFPSILPHSSQSVLRPCSCSGFPVHHTEYISLLPCIVIPVNPWS